MFERLNVDFDVWVRTTSRRHELVVKTALTRLHQKGLITKRQYAGLYCVGCEQFKKPTDLNEAGQCPDHLIVPNEMEEVNYFLALGKSQSWLIDILKNREGWIKPDFYKRELLAMLKEPLEDLCISRPRSRVSLGIELPFDSNYVTYVWFDALLNYLTNLGWPDENYLEWWPFSVHLMAKDIIKTHCIYWPVILKELDVDPPQEYRVHGFWVGEGGVKMSKTLGNVVSTDELIGLVGVDGLRFHLIKTLKGSHAPITNTLVVDTYNADLANNIGNLYSRIVKFAQKNYQMKIPAPTRIVNEDASLRSEIIDTAKNASKTADVDTAPEYVHQILRIADLMNLHLAKVAPWRLSKEPSQQDRLDSVIYVTGLPSAPFRSGLSCYAPDVQSCLGELKFTSYPTHDAGTSF